MAPHVVEAVRLSKVYRLGNQPDAYLTLRGALAAAFSRSRSGATTSRQISALKDVDLTVEQGEVVGIIGRNGAGKTTLLKLLTRITEPTTGVIRHRGRVGALLEVGTGFHSELTGRENIYLNGAILGMRKAEIDRNFDQIVDFADISPFIDTPVKRYSSGMRMRLAFAVAAHLEPEILVVDEVLAVGDVAFQRKCLGKMESVAKGGRTVFFVSHNLAAVEALCQRVCWIESGRIAADGTPRQVISDYLNSVVRTTTARVWEDPLVAPGNERVRLRSARVFPSSGGSDEPITVHTPFVLEFEYENLEPGAYLNLSLHLYTADGVLVLNAVPVNERQWWGQPFPVGRYRDRCIVPGELLNDGTYRVELMIVKDASHVIFADDAILEFDVHDAVTSAGVFEGEWVGVVRPSLQWRTERIG